MEYKASVGTTFDSRIEIIFKNNTILKSELVRFTQYDEVTHINKVYYFTAKNNELTEREIDNMLIDNEKIIDLIELIQLKI